MSNRSFPFSGNWLRILLLLAIVLTGASTGASAQGLRDNDNPNSGAEPDRIIRTGGAIPGIYNIDYISDYYILDPLKYPVDGQIGFWKWSQLNASQGGYSWSRLDDWIKKRVDKGLGAGIMISTYDTVTADDIRATPNWVIKIADAVLPATTSTGIEHYIDYYHRTRSKHKNGEFDSGLAYWTVSDPTAIVVNATPPGDSHTSTTPTMPDRPSEGPALQLGGANSLNATIAHEAEAIPAMPPSLAGKQNVYVSARVHINTTDTNPNDHLYMELWDANDNKLGGTQVDINNLSHAGQGATYWQAYTFNVTSFATEKDVKVVFRVVTDGAAPTTFYVDNVQLRVRHLIPKYWGDAYKGAYKTFISELGKRYKTTSAAGVLGGDPKYNLQFIAMGTGAYGESQPVQDVLDWEYGSSFDHVVKAAGMDTSGEWIDLVKEISLAYSTAFASGDPYGPTRHLLIQYAPSFMSGEERGYTTDYAASLGIGLSHNRLTPEFQGVFMNNRAGFYDPIRLYWNNVPIAFEAYDTDLECSPVLAYWAVASAMEKKADYIRTAPPLLRNDDGSVNTAFASIFDDARPYLGKTVQTAPSVWTIMREHRNPVIQTCGDVRYNTTSVAAKFPQFGNFNYWLYQVDTIAGGRTVAETNDKGADSRYAYYKTKDGSGNDVWIKATQAGLGLCGEKDYSAIYASNPPVCNPQPYNQNLPALVGQNPNDYTDFYYPWDWTGGGKEAYVVRRTDQATSNPYMFFMIDDGYITPGPQVYKAEITVGYFDIGNDQWSLKYHSSSGEKIAGTVPKTGTNQYKEITFTVTDAKFGGGAMGGSDFFLDSRAPNGTNDGNEWVHKVDVKKLDAVVQPTDTPTATATPTQTATPTVTPTSTPTTGIVDGRAYHDANQNGAYDAGEALLSGAVMALLNGASVEVYTQTSGAGGVFRFPAVNPGQYKLIEKSPPPGYAINTTYAAGVTFLLSANQTMTGFDVGHQQQATSTPTATATATATATVTATRTPTATLTTTAHRTYLPLVLR